MVLAGTTTEGVLKTLADRYMSACQSVDRFCHLNSLAVMAGNNVVTTTE